MGRILINSDFLTGIIAGSCGKTELEVGYKSNYITPTKLKDGFNFISENSLTMHV